MRARSHFLLGVAMVLQTACGSAGSGDNGPTPPYPGAPPLGAEILRTDGTVIQDGSAADTGWRWIPFANTTCTTAALVETSPGSGTYRYEFGTAPTGLAISWGSEASNDLVVFLQGGGACWDFFTCGGGYPLDSALTPTATTGPFGPSEFAVDVYDTYPASWVHRANLPASLADATIVFVPYCTGDIHGGDKVTTYSPPQGLGFLPSVTWNHVGHANVMAFLQRLGATFPAPSKLVVAGSSAGGFGTLANYPAFRWYWPDAKGYLIDDSAPPLIGNAIPSTTRSAWYASWNLAESLGRFCPGCATDMSQGIAELADRFPDDRIALVSHLQDQVIRDFFGTITFSPPYLVPMDATVFEAQLRLLGTNVMDPATANAKYFFTNTAAPTDHPALNDPSVVTSPGAGLTPWLEEMISDATTWASVSDP